MRNPFAKPETPGQWLLGSVCWTVVCLGGWPLLSYTLDFWPQLVGYPFRFRDWLLVSCFWVAHSLVWRKSISNGRNWLRTIPPTKPELGVVANVWLVLLIFLQLLLLLAGIFCTVFFLLFELTPATSLQD